MSLRWALRGLYSLFTHLSRTQEPASRDDCTKVEPPYNSCMYPYHVITDNASIIINHLRLIIRYQKQMVYVCVCSLLCVMLQGLHDSFYDDCLNT